MEDTAGQCYALATRYDRRGWYRRAIAVLERALRIRSDFPEAQILLGTIYEKLGNREKAIEAYKQYLRSKGDYSRVAPRLAALYGGASSAVPAPPRKRGRRGG